MIFYIISEKFLPILLVEGTFQGFQQGENFFRILVFSFAVGAESKACPIMIALFRIFCYPFDL